MHSAPSVSYPVGRSRFMGWFIFFANVAGVLAGWLWYQQLESLGWRQWLFSGSLIASCFLAFQTWRRVPQGHISWDGQVWCWTCGAISTQGSVTIHLDFQSVMLLRLNTKTAGRIWLWPERHVDVTRWVGLRRIVFSRRHEVQVTSEGSEPHMHKVRA